MVEHFAGAKLAGWIELVARTGPPVRVTFSGERAPPLTIHEAFAEPGDAPFAAVFGGFVDRMTTLVSHARGPGAAEKIFGWPRAEILGSNMGPPFPNACGVRIFKTVN